ncbi:MAG: glucose-1-phosphate cytidylyltransferase [Acidimicrobiales bacterium]
MKVLILAGGLGTRLSEETATIPKPMVEIGERPILWHIMKLYSHYGFHEFVILLGYRGHQIREYFASYLLRSSDVTLHLADNHIEVHKSRCEPWKVTLLDSGRDTMTGGRIRQAKPYVGDEPFLLTYGDGVSDINLHELVAFHKGHPGAATVSVIRPEGRFGAVAVESDDRVAAFNEKPAGDGRWVNGGFFVCDPAVFDYISDDDNTIFERAPLEDLARDQQLKAYRHTGFWHCVDTLHDKVRLNELWNSGDAPWRVWDDG